MEAAVKKCEESQHSAETNQLRQMKNLPQRRDRQRDDQEPHRPIARGVLDVIRSGWRPIARERFPDRASPAATRQIRNTTTFVHLLVRMEFIAVSPLSVIFLQVHSAVQARHLIAISIEHLRGRVLKNSRQAPFRLPGSSADDPRLGFTLE